MDGVAEQDLARGRRALEARRRAERAARRERRPPRTGADEHLARLDAELHAEPDVAFALERGARLAQLDRGAGRAQRVVLVQPVLAEHAHDRVAREALDRAAVPLDHRAAASP